MTQERKLERERLKKEAYESGVLMPDIMNPDSIIIKPETISTEKPTDSQMFAAGFKNPKQIENLAYIMKDIMQGEASLTKREEYSYLNFKQIKIALDWLMNSGFDTMLQGALLEKPYLLTFKDKPPTAEEFLTKKYIGSMADSIWLPVRKNFLNFFDPTQPFRSAILNPSIGSGKKVTITSPIQVGYEDYYEVTDDSGMKYSFSEGQSIWYKNKYVSIEKLIGIGKLTLSRVNYINMMIYDIEKIHLFDDAFNLKTYDSLINYFKKVNDDIYTQWGIYTQKHHIIPRSEGGSDDKDNLIKLPYYFHLMAHYLRGKEAEATDNKLVQYKNYKAVCWALKENSLPKNVIEMHEKLQIVVESLEKRKLLEKQKIWITDGQKSLQIFNFEEIPAGWKKGRTFRSPASKKWVNKDGKNFYVEKEKVEEYLEKGYSLGMFQTEKMKNSNHASYSTKDTKWMYKGKERRCVKLEDIDTFKNDGWALGHNYKSSWTKGSKAAIHKDNVIKYVDKETVNEFLSNGWKIGTGYNSHTRTFNDNN